MSQNYMDYSDDRCLNTFTRDQLERMEAVLANAPRRKMLIQNADIIAATPDDLLAASVRIFPNPAIDRIHIDVQGRWPALRLRLLNLSGQIQEEIQLTQMSADLAVEHLPKGLYLLEITGPAVRTTRRVLLQ